MKVKLLVGVAIAVYAASAAFAADKTTVIPGQDNSTVILEREGKAPVVLDENKDIKGKIETSKQPDEEKSPVKNSSKANSSPETTGANTGEEKPVKKPAKNCIKESWMGDRPSETCG